MDEYQSQTLTRAEAEAASVQGSKRQWDIVDSFFCNYCEPPYCHSWSCAPGILLDHAEIAAFGQTDDI